MSLSMGASHSTLRIGFRWRRTDQMTITNSRAMVKKKPIQKLGLIMARPLCDLLAKRGALRRECRPADGSQYWVLRCGLPA